MVRHGGTKHGCRRGGRAGFSFTDLEQREDRMGSGRRKLGRGRRRKFQRRRSNQAETEAFGVGGGPRRCRKKAPGGDPLWRRASIGESGTAGEGCRATTVGEVVVGFGQDGGGCCRGQGARRWAARRGGSPGSSSSAVKKRSAASGGVGDDDDIDEGTGNRGSVKRRRSAGRRASSVELGQRVEGDGYGGGRPVGNGGWWFARSSSEKPSLLDNVEAVEVQDLRQGLDGRWRPAARNEDPAGWMVLTVDLGFRTEEWRWLGDGAGSWEEAVETVANDGETGGERRASERWRIDRSVSRGGLTAAARTRGDRMGFLRLGRGQQWRVGNGTAIDRRWMAMGGVSLSGRWEMHGS